MIESKNGGQVRKLGRGELAGREPALARRANSPAAIGGTRPRRTSDAEPALVMLDMGEASREQGFRRNGCR